MDVNEKQIFESSVIKAIMTGNFETIEKYIDSHNVNDFFHTGWTPILYAALAAQVKIIEYLIKNGADVNKHKDGYTPLMALCSSTENITENRIICLKLLIKAGANLHASNKQRQTPLMIACMKQEAEFISELIKYVKNVNACDNRKQSALTYATIANKSDIVKILIENEADATLTDCSDLTAKDIASMKGYDKILSLLTFDEEEVINTYEIAKIQDWRDMFPSLTNINNETIDFDIFTVLHGMGLENYGYLFQGMSFETFLKLTEDDLDSLGIQINAHKIQFIEHLHKFHRKQWSIQSIGAVNKSLPYTLYDGVISLGIVAKQVTVIGSSFCYVINNLQRTSNQNKCLTQDQILNFGKELKNAKKTLDVIKKELVQVQALSEKIQKKSDIGIPATYIGPRSKTKTTKRYLPILLSIAAIAGIYISKTMCIQRLTT